MTDAPYQHPVPGLDALSRGVAIGTISRANYLYDRLGSFWPESNPIQIDALREDRDDEGVKWAARALARDMTALATLPWRADTLTDCAEFVIRAAGIPTIDPAALDDTGLAIAGIRDPDPHPRERPDDYSLLLARAVYESRDRLQTEQSDRITYLLWIARALRRDLETVGSFHKGTMHLALHRARVKPDDRVALMHMEAARDRLY